MSSSKEIAELLSKAGEAHHIFEQNELHGVYDKDWPTWYADWLIRHGLNTLLKAQWDVSQLAHLLDKFNKQHKQSSKGLSWAQFTAEELLKGDR